MKAFINEILYKPLFNLLILIAWIVPGHSIGVAIIILTVILRLILLPSSIKTAHHQVKSLKLQPKINKIRSEIKDQQEQSKALMSLYKEEGFSPFGSCLPLLVQIPIIWVLFAVFKSGLSVENFSSLYSFVPRTETINTIFFGLVITKADPWVLPIIAGVLQFGLSYLRMLPQKRYVKPGQNDPTAMMGKQMLIVAPLITIFFGHSMPAALVFYWITTTVFGIGQQLYVNKKIMTEEDSMPQAPKQAAPIKKDETTSPKAENKKRDLISSMMDKRLVKEAKKTGVNVAVRTKKKQ